MASRRAAAWPAAVAVAIAVVLPAALRLPGLAWPLNQLASAACCGHPDEDQHVERMRATRGAGAAGFEHPPGFGVAAALAASVGVTRVAAWMAPAVAEASRVRDVLAGRVLSLFAAALAVWLTARLARSCGLGRAGGAIAATFVATSPLVVVYAGFALPDILNMALVAGYAALFLAWARRPTASRAAAFAAVAGAAIAVKFGVLIALAPAMFMVIQASRRFATTAALAAGGILGLFVASGGVLLPAGLAAVAGTVFAENVAARESAWGWNLVSLAGSTVPGLGAHAILALLAGGIAWGRLRAGVRDPRVWLAAGGLLHILAAATLDGPFSRHMLPVYPLLAAGAATGCAAWPWSRRQGAPAIVWVLAAGLGLAAARPVAASFERGAWDAAVVWLDRSIPETDCVVLSPRVPDVVRRRVDRACDAGAAPRWLVVHSHWSGRVTGSWWLKPRPRAPGEVWNPGRPVLPGVEDRRAELDRWQALFDGRDPAWRPAAAFGDDWPTLERWLLALAGRGYDQFASGGRLVVFAAGDGAVR